MDDNVAYLISDVSRLLRKRFDLAAREIGVTGPQWRVLLMVLRKPGINQGTLADLLDVEPITTCRMVDRLEQAGHIERRRDPADRRAWQLHVTPAAEPVIEKLAEIGGGLIDETIGWMGHEEQMQLTASMRRLRERLLANAQPVDPLSAKAGAR